ncbi:MAG TPA: hypothetical protein VF705_15035 [Longimicrobium sp.]|jgi:hypothetical protein
MKRCVLALAGLLALPVCAQAQTGPVYTPERHPQQLPHSRFSITPFVAARIPYNTGSFYVFGLENGQDILVETEREGTPALGLNADLRVTGPFSITGGVAYSGGQQDIYTFGNAGDSVPEGRFIADAPSMGFAKLGITARLPDPIRDDRRFHPSAFVTVAPALVYLNHGSGSAFEDSYHFALNLGADATTRIGRSNFAFQVGLEDYITFWNTDEFTERDLGFFADDPRFEGEPVGVDYDYSTANIFLLRLGVSYRPGRSQPMETRTFTAPPPVAAAPSAATTPLSICVVRDGQLAQVDAVYDPERADTLVDGRPVAMAHPSDALPYAAGATWFINREQVTANNRRYSLYGLPRVIPARQLQRSGEFRGVPLFVEAGATDQDVLYVPVRAGCEFQPYQSSDTMGAVRG